MDLALKEFFYMVKGLNKSTTSVSQTFAQCIPSRGLGTGWARFFAIANPAAKPMANSLKAKNYHFLEVARHFRVLGKDFRPFGRVI